MREIKLRAWITTTNECFMAINLRKHRYIYFNAKGRRKKELLGLLKYEILPYPKTQLVAE